MIINTKKQISENEITDSAVFHQRRQLIKSSFLGGIAALGLLPATNSQAITRWGNVTKANVASSALTVTEEKIVNNYTNYYEFSYEKTQSTDLAQALTIDPWSVLIKGEVEKPGQLYLEDILKQFSMQEYIYRFRCVEAWSMVVPWIGFPLAELVKSVKPLSSAKFVKFTTAYRPDEMPNQKDTSMLEWPYVEGLRIDEAVHPLTLLAVGCYGDTLPKQNGAPLRLVVPWKYGFKSIKAIVEIEFLSRAPLTTWNKAAPHDYGFYANVNPSVPHPRWSQSSERVLGSSFFSPRRTTELFNGYGDDVASLYQDMDLRHFY
ncbi:MAG: protein-methionine-sulfoxide reductase catalytic subunit MsrP [Methylovulum sp.]|jgi:sulfoxide reductase catalytic subunit YedY|nr:protein-methionine-sulfoxide reductase catalytic subunit MsrP [Methylovulum sp.]TSA37465.1 MAG: protein-methionine-sulfoxide reductase catalytic subunit MsrP [Methylococcaceae bacterium]